LAGYMTVSKGIVLTSHLIISTFR